MKWSLQGYTAGGGRGVSVSRFLTHYKMLPSPLFFILCFTLADIGIISRLFHLGVRPCQRHVRNQFLLQALLRSHPFTLRKELLGLGFVFWKACCLTFILRLPMSLGDSPSLLSVAMSLAIASQEHLVSIRKSVGMVLHELS